MYSDALREKEAIALAPNFRQSFQTLRRFERTTKASFLVVDRGRCAWRGNDVFPVFVTLTKAKVTLPW